VKSHIETDIVHGIHTSDKESGAHSMPIYQTSTFCFQSAEHGGRLFKGEEQGYRYTRLGNPNTDAVGQKIALLEGFEAGLTTASGMAAIANVILATSQAGDHIIFDDTVYGGTHYLIDEEIKRIGIEVTRLDLSQSEKLADVIKENTTLIFIETPANPTLKLIDINQIAEIAHHSSALLCVDNTFQTPFLQQPKLFGADIVLHSATKYISGHGDVVAGVITGSSEFIQRARKVAINYGWTMAPFNAWLLLRGLKTLGLRMERCSQNAEMIALWLNQHPQVETVYYPFLPENPQIDLARRQQRMGGGIIAFELKGAYKAGCNLMNSVGVHTLAVSLGDCDSLIQHPASMTHAGMNNESMQEAHITPGLVRVSVGVEHVDDLIADLDQALQCP
jgi:methionine-gamma-lyase